MEGQKSRRKARNGFRKLTFTFALSYGIKSIMRLVTTQKNLPTTYVSYALGLQC